MNIVLVGLNHRTAPISLREQLSLAECGTRMALEDLGINQDSSQDAIATAVPLKEVVILSTCNRLEVYASVNGDPCTGRDAIEAYLANLQGLPQLDLRRHLYSLFDDEAVRHLLRVAAGLDSMILGEPQILGQVAGAQLDAQRVRTIGPVLNQLFDRAVRAGKRSRNETEIGRHSTSVSHTAVGLIKDEMGSLSEINVLVVGAGEMAEVAARALAAEGTENLCFINRTYARAENMARDYSGKAINWYHLPAALVDADVVVTATGAPHVVIHESDVKPILAERKGRRLYIVDIAVPRDVEESIGNLSDVHLFDIDQLQTVVDANVSQRQAAVPFVEEIVSQEAARFSEWLSSRQVLPVLVELRHKARDIANSELRRYENRLNEMAAGDQELVTQIVHRIVSKILHEPTVRLKTSAAEGNGFEYAQTIRDLFALKSASTTPSWEEKAQEITKQTNTRKGQPGETDSPNGASKVPACDPRFEISQ